jgi:hypothetical protein
MPIPETYRPIINKLIARTTAGTALWTDQRGQYALHFDQYSFSIFEYNEDRDEGVVCILRDKAGKIIDNFSVERGEGDYKTLKGLFDMARRRALKVDDAIDSLKNALDTDGVIGEVENDIPF